MNFVKIAYLASILSATSAQITVNTPTRALSAVQCEIYQITWTGGTGPFDIRLLDTGQNLVEEITPSANSSPFPWTVNQPAGQSFSLSIQDSIGDSGATAAFIIQPSANSGCLGE